jgi:hypothetical protein
VKAHRIDPFSLAAGVLFTALGVGFLLDELDVWTADVTWVPAIVLIVLGLGGVLAGVLRARPAE